MSYRNGSHLCAPTQQPEPQLFLGIFSPSASEYVFGSHRKLYISRQEMSCLTPRQTSLLKHPVPISYFLLTHPWPSWPSEAILYL